MDNTINLKEQLLLQNIVEGNHHAFWQLWLLYQDYLYHRCLIWMGHNHLDAEEALSLARLNAWEKLPNYASKITNPKAWLTRITHNLCIDLHRKRQRQANNTDSIEEIAVTSPDMVCSLSDSPESAILHDELKIYIHGAINALPPRLRDTWNLFYYHQMSHSEIAQKLMLSKHNVYKRIQQGRIILQKQLNKYFSGVNSSFNLRQIAPVLNQQSEISNSRKQNCSQRLSAIDNDCATKTTAKPTLSDCPIPVLTESPKEIINYQVTALCLEQLSLAC